MTETIGELCMGYGGLGCGLSMALGGDTRIAWGVEYDGVDKRGDLTGPKRILAHRYPDMPLLHDVKTTRWEDLEPVDWLTAGYPCQPFSLAGLRKGADDPRHLWPGVARAIGVLRPRGVLLENVAAHLRDGFDVVLGDLAAMGYDARWGVVRASDAGAPHERARVFVVAARADAAPERRRGTEGQQCGVGAAGLLAHSAADADRLGHERLGRARDGWAGPADSGVDAPDAASAGLEGRRPECHGTGPAQSADRGSAPSDADRRSAVWPMPRGVRPAGSSAPDDVRWGMYGPAIARWEHVLGRPAPRPTEPGRRGERLSPRFVEFLMGLPAGWVTDVPGLPRNAQLKALGNGVVPQQAALACRLLGVTTRAVAA